MAQEQHTENVVLTAAERQQLSEMLNKLIEAAEETVRRLDRIPDSVAEMRVQFIQAQQIHLPPPETPTKQKRRKK